MGAEQRQRAAEGDLWEGILAHLKARLNPHTFTTWFRPTRLQGIRGQRVIVSVPNRTFEKWLASDGQGPVKQALRALGLERYRVEYVAEADNPTPADARRQRAVPQPRNQTVIGPGARAFAKLRGIRDSSLTLTESSFCSTIVVAENQATGSTFKSVPHLARDAKIDPSTAWRDLCRLVKMGVVERCPRPGQTSFLSVSLAGLCRAKRPAKETRTPLPGRGVLHHVEGTPLPHGALPLHQEEPISLTDLPTELPRLPSSKYDLGWLTQQAIEVIRTREENGEFDGVKLELRARAAAQGLTCDARMLDDAIEAARDVLVREARQ